MARLLLATAWSTLLVLLVITASRVQSETVEYDFVIKRESLMLDGVNSSVITINGQTPGPEIRVSPGDEVIVNVLNDNIEEGTSVHWHGQHLRNGDLYYDGVPFVTQCEILQNDTYTYRFTVNDSPGAYFYHGHQQAQRGDGLLGPFIIESPDEPIADVEYDVIIQDWYHAPGEKIVEGLNSVPFKWAGDPQSILVNGIGRFNESVPPDFAEFEGSSGDTMLLRLINAGVLSYLNFEIEGHNITVIEADGQPVQPFEVPNIDVNIGERYAVLIKMDQPTGIYPIRVAIKYRNERVGQAMLVYKGADPSIRPEIITNSTAAALAAPTIARRAAIGGDFIMDPSDIRGAAKLPADMTSPDAELILEGRQGFNNNGQLRWPVNHNTPNQAWSEPRANIVPLGSTPNTWRYPYGTILDIVLQNFPAGNGVVEQHPWHLHGHSFYVLGRGPGRFNRTEHESLLNYEDPPLRDMVTLYPDGENTWVAPKFVGEEGERPSGWAVVRVRLDNPGTWMVHCHIAWHLAMEMSGFIITEPSSENALPEAPVDFPQCTGNTTGTMPSASVEDDSGAQRFAAATQAVFAGIFAAAAHMLLSIQRI